jgi:hypothetical protein
VNVIPLKGFSIIGIDKVAVNLLIGVLRSIIIVKINNQI